MALGQVTTMVLLFSKRDIGVESLPEVVEK
jgi:hypothetical protein